MSPRECQRLAHGGHNHASGPTLSPNSAPRCTAPTMPAPRALTSAVSCAPKGTCARGSGPVAPGWRLSVASPLSLACDLWWMSEPDRMVPTRLPRQGPRLPGTPAPQASPDLSLLTPRPKSVPFCRLQGPGHGCTEGWGGECPPLKVPRMQQWLSSPPTAASTCCVWWVASRRPRVHGNWPVAHPHARSQLHQGGSRAPGRLMLWGRGAGPGAHPEAPSGTERHALPSSGRVRAPGRSHA